MKVLATAIVLATLALLQLTSGFPNVYYQNNVQTRDSFFWGQRKGGERLLYETRVCHSDYIIRQYLFRKSSTPRLRYGFDGKVTVELDIPCGGTISFIEVRNMAKGGYVCIARGGIGYSWVSLHFESNYNRDMDFSVRVYGHY